MSVKEASAGNRGDGIRSDCWARIQLTDSGGIKLDLKSKVEVLYGDSIKRLVEDMMKFFEIANADVTVEDYGAVPYVLLARIETAVRRLDRRGIMNPHVLLEPEDRLEVPERFF